MDDAVRDAVVEAAIAGASIKAIAMRYECSTTEVRTLLDQYAAEVLKPSNRAAMLALEVARLEHLETVFARHAVANMDVAAGVLVARLSQRKAALCGLDQPVRMDMSVVVEPCQETSTENLRRVLDELTSRRSSDQETEQK